MRVHLRRDHMHQERVRIAHRLPRDAFQQLAQAYALSDHERADVYLEMLGNLRRQALDLDVALHEIDQSALLLDAGRLAAERHRHGDGNRPVERRLVEVDVQQLVADGIDLVVLHQHLARAPAVDAEPEQRVDARLGVQHLEQRLGSHLDRLRPAFLAAVEHRRQHSGLAQPPGLVLPPLIPRRRGQLDVHRPACLPRSPSAAPAVQTNREETDVS